MLEVVPPRAGSAVDTSNPLSSRPDLDRRGHWWRQIPIYLLVVYFCFMAVTNRRLSVLDDEATIITAANGPARTTLQLFLAGTGQHEHPPLSDLLLHGWLVLTHHSFAWLRISSILCYVCGLLFLSMSARILGNDRSSSTTLWLGMLWPFGYFYARITGWYTLCFLLVSLLTFTYLKLIQRPSLRRWGAFTLCAIVLVWSNYFGVILLFVLLFDLLLFRRPVVRSSPLQLLFSVALIVVSFLPLLRALLFDARGTVKPAAVPMFATIGRLGYALFALLGSVAVAPWFLPWSIPIAIAGATLVVLLLCDRASRRFTLYFLLLVAALALSSHLDLKRLLFITPWMLLAIALLVTQAGRTKARLAIGSLIVIFLVGWLGIATGLHPATVNFYEPWQQVAADTGNEARAGKTIVSDSVPYFFYLNQFLNLRAAPSRGTYLGQNVYRLEGVKVLDGSLPAGTKPSGEIIVVRGVATADRSQAITDTMDRLTKTCRHVGETRQVPDPAFSYKKLLDSQVPLVRYRVAVDTFSCPE